MTATMTAKTVQTLMRRLDADYARQGLSVDTDAERWVVRVDGRVIAERSRPLHWAVALERQGVDIKAA